MGWKPRTWIPSCLHSDWYNNETDTITLNYHPMFSISPLLYYNICLLVITMYSMYHNECFVFYFRFVRLTSPYQIILWVQWLSCSRFLCHNLHWLYWYYCFCFFKLCLRYTLIGQGVSTTYETSDVQAAFPTVTRWGCATPFRSGSATYLIQATSLKSIICRTSTVAYILCSY